MAKDRTAKDRTAKDRMAKDRTVRDKTGKTVSTMGTTARGRKAKKSLAASRVDRPAVRLPCSKLAWLHLHRVYRVTSAIKKNRSDDCKQIGVSVKNFQNFRQFGKP